MEIEVTKPYIRHMQRENDNARVINIYGGTYNFDILVGLMYKQNINDSNTLYGGTEPLHKASIVIGTDFLGQLNLIKNRYGMNGQTDEHEIRQAILDSMVSMGFTHLESSRIILEFNRCLSEIIGQEILYMREFPYGITRRRYMIDEHKKTIIKKYCIKRHQLV